MRWVRLECFRLCALPFAFLSFGSLLVTIFRLLSPLERRLSSLFTMPLSRPRQLGSGQERCNLPTQCVDVAIPLGSVPVMRLVRFASVLDLNPVSLSAFFLVYIALLLPHRFDVTRWVRSLALPGPKLVVLQRSGKTEENEIYTKVLDTDVVNGQGLSCALIRMAICTPRL